MILFTGHHFTILRANRQFTKHDLNQFNLLKPDTLNELVVFPTTLVLDYGVTFYLFVVSCCF